MGGKGSTSRRRLYFDFDLCGRNKKIYDARPLLKKNIYAQLNNLIFFMSAKVDCGTVIWNDDVDIAPEHLYENSIPI